MEVVRKYIDAESLMTVMKLPEKFRNRKLDRESDASLLKYAKTHAASANTPTAAAALGTYSLRAESACSTFWAAMLKASKTRSRYLPPNIVPRRRIVTAKRKIPPSARTSINAPNAVLRNPGLI